MLLSVPDEGVRKRLPLKDDLRLFVPTLDINRIALEALRGDSKKSSERKAQTSRQTKKLIAALPPITARAGERNVTSIITSLVNATPVATGEVVLARLDDILPASKLSLQKLKQLPEFDALTARGQAETSSLDISHRKLGNQHVYVIISGLTKRKVLENFFLRDNRITDQGFVGIFDTLLSSDCEIVAMDLSENSLKSEGSLALSKYLEFNSSMVKLTLQNVGLNDGCMKALAIGLQRASLLRTLVLRENCICDDGAVILGNLLKQELGITELDVSWNKFQALGAKAIADALCHNTCLASLDLSWNAVGSTGDAGRCAAKSLSEMFAVNKSLTHLDLSNNQFNIADCLVMASGLSENHTLLGLHMTNNACRVDAHGFLFPDSEPWPLEAAHSISRIIGEKAYGRETWSFRNSCWICGGWKERRFRYKLSAVDIEKILGHPFGHDPMESTAEEVEQTTEDDDNSSLEFSDNGTFVGLHAKRLQLMETRKKRREQVEKEHIAILQAASVQLLTSFDNWTAEPMQHVDSLSSSLDNSDEPLEATAALNGFSFLSPTKQRGNGGNDSSGKLSSGKRGASSLRVFIPSPSESAGRFLPLPSPLASPAKRLQIRPPVDVEFHLYRMVPPGRHYYAFSVNNAAPIFDYFQPNLDWKCNRLKFTTTSGVVLPKQINVVDVPQSAESDKRKGIRTVFTKPRYRITAEKSKIWTPQDSLFATQPYLLGDPSLLQRCFASDWRLSKYCNSEDSGLVEKLERLLNKHFELLKDVFVHYSCLYSSEHFTMAVGAFNELLLRCRILEFASTEQEQGKAPIPASLGEAAEAPRGSEEPAALIKKSENSEDISPTPEQDVFPVSIELKPLPPTDRRSTIRQNDNPRSRSMARKTTIKRFTQRKSSVSECSRADTDTMFISHCLTGPKHELNGKRSLNRFQFIDVMVAVACAKFMKNKTCQNVPGAVEKLLVEHLMPFAERDDSSTFRKEYLVTQEVDDCLRKHLDVLQKVYHLYATPKAVEEEHMSLPQWLELCESAKFSSVGIVDRTCRLFFCNSQPPVVSPFDEEMTGRKMLFLSFLEAIVRVSFEIAMNKYKTALTGNQGAVNRAGRRPSFEGLPAPKKMFTFDDPSDGEAGAGDGPSAPTADEVECIALSDLTVSMATVIDLLKSAVESARNFGRRASVSRVTK